MHEKWLKKQKNYKLLREKCMDFENVFKFSV
jgi:hypothetical protein